MNNLVVRLKKKLKERRRKRNPKESLPYRLIRRFLTWFGDIYFATKPPLIKAANIRKLLKLLKPGDIICREYISYLDSYFIKGKYSHSGICINKDHMIHSIAEGVENIDPIDFVKDCDGFVLIRPSYKNKKQIKKALRFSIDMIGKPYNFLFEQGEKWSRFYCHELVFNALKQAGLKLTHSESIIYADDIIKHCKIIYEI